MIYRTKVILSEIIKEINLHKDDSIILAVTDRVRLVQYSIDSKNINNVKVIAVQDLLKGFLDNVKFDYIVGNPPYQDGSKSGGQNKIYNQISKKCISLLSYNSKINFITPVSVLKNSKRFSLIGLKGLKSVNFKIDEQFNVGVNIISWVIDKTYDGLVEVTNKDDSITYYKNNDFIMDSSIDSKIIHTYLKMKNKHVKGRMFSENNIGPSYRSKIYTNTYKYALHKTVENMYYSRKIPNMYKLPKIVIPISKSLNLDSIIFTKDDYGENYVFTEDTSRDNILSFILSNTFENFCKEIKNYNGHGFNTALRYLPKFDTSKHWDSKSVKEFLENI